jgi:gas vesicle protein
MSDRDGDFGAFLSGFVIGGLVGAAVALLMAPQSGEETRAMIRDKSIELKEQVEQTAADARAQAEQFAVDARTRAESIAKDARIKAEELQKRGQVVLEEQKTRIEKAIDAGKKAAQSKRAEIEGDASGEA